MPVRINVGLRLTMSHVRLLRRSAISHGPRIVLRVDRRDKCGTNFRHNGTKLAIKWPDPTHIEATLSGDLLRRANSMLELSTQLDDKLGLSKVRCFCSAIFLVAIRSGYHTRPIRTVGYISNIRCCRRRACRPSRLVEPPEETHRKPLQFFWCP